MEHIDGRIVRHDSRHAGEGVEQECVERIPDHVVVLDFACRTLVIHIIGWVCHHKVRTFIRHQKRESVRFRAVPANEPMSSQQPQVALLGDGWLLKLCIDIEVIILDAVLNAILEQSIDFIRLEARERNIKVCALQIGDKQSQLFLVPLTAYFVEGDIKRLFLFGIQFDYNAVHFGHAHVEQHLQSLVTADHAPSGLVPDDRLDIPKLLNGAFQLLVFGVTGSEVFSRIVFCGQQFRCAFLFNQH